MRDFLQKLFHKAPKGIVAFPFALAAVALVTVLTIPFLGNNTTSQNENKGPVISFQDKEDDDDEDNNVDEDADTGNNQDNNNNSENSGDLVGDAGSNDNVGNNDSSSDSEDGKDDSSSNSGSTSNPSGSTEEKPDDSNDAGNNSGSSNDNSGNGSNNNHTGSTDLNVPGVNLADIPEYSGDDYYVLNNNTPFFSTTNLSTNAFEFYSDLDSLGRCGVVYACLGPELLPTTERGDIDSVTPSGWVSSDGSGNSLYNRSHLIAHSLAGEDANEKNLITGTSHMNQYTMQEFENIVLNYIKETGNHVLYRVTPMFDGDNLVATGVQMEAWSIEDNGEICFNVFCYNIQKGVIIDYATGNYSLEESVYLYIVNGNNKNGKIHTYECGIKSNLKTPIPCKTLEEAIEKSKEITGSSTPLYAGCCMKDMNGSNNDNSHILGHSHFTDYIIRIVTLNFSKITKNCYY